MRAEGDGGARQGARAAGGRAEEAEARAAATEARPRPPSRTNWTRLVPPPVLTGHVSSPLFSARRWSSTATPPPQAISCRRAPRQRSSNRKVMEAEAGDAARASMRVQMTSFVLTQRILGDSEYAKQARPVPAARARLLRAVRGWMLGRSAPETRTNMTLRCAVQLGVNYSGIVQNHYSLNGRYRRAWWINPGATPNRAERKMR